MYISEWVTSNIKKHILCFLLHALPKYLITISDNLRQHDILYIFSIRMAQRFCLYDFSNSRYDGLKSDTPSNTQIGIKFSENLEISI